MQSKRCRGDCVGRLAIRLRLAKALLQHQRAADFRKKGVESDASL